MEDNNEQPLVKLTPGQAEAWLMNLGRRLNEMNMPMDAIALATAVQTLSIERSKLRKELDEMKSKERDNDVF